MRVCVHGGLISGRWSPVENERVVCMEQEEAQSAQAEMRDLEDLLIAARMKLADAEYERGLAMSKSKTSASGT